MSDDLKMYQVEYSATVVGSIQVEAESYTDAKVKAGGRLKQEGFPREPESMHHIDSVCIEKVLDE